MVLQRYVCKCLAQKKKQLCMSLYSLRETTLPLLGNKDANLQTETGLHKDERTRIARLLSPACLSFE